MAGAGLPILAEIEVRLVADRQRPSDELSAHHPITSRGAFGCLPARAGLQDIGIGNGQSGSIRALARPAMVSLHRPVTATASAATLAPSKGRLMRCTPHQGSG
jgi:hypothetical protein